MNTKNKAGLATGGEKKFGDAGASKKGYAPFKSLDADIVITVNAALFDSACIATSRLTQATDEETRAFWDAERAACETAYHVLNGYPMGIKKPK